MKLSNLTFIVTDDCNFNCAYCVQKKEKKTISNACIKKAVDFFYPFFKTDEKVHCGFYGGEPLMAYDRVKYAAQLVLEKNKTGNKKIEFSLTTNGTLLTDKMLDFFNQNHFALMLSFDGLAQELGRKKGTLKKMVRVVKQIQDYPEIDFDINSVFTPDTISRFSESLRFLIELEGPEITFNLSTMEEWKPPHLAVLKKELERLVDFLVLYYKKTGRIPVKNFQAPVPGPGVFRCSAGSEHMAVTPEGKVWGCFLFHDYFKTREASSQYRDFYFGTLTDFIVNYESRYPGIAAHYSELRQDFFQVEEHFCFLCRDVKSCMVCPVNAAYSSGSLGKISCRQCQLNKIQLKARGSFYKNRP